MNTRHAERVEGCGSPVETSARSAEAPTEPAGETKSFCPCQKETVTVLVTVSFLLDKTCPRHARAGLRRRALPVADAARRGWRSGQNLLPLQGGINFGNRLITLEEAMIYGRSGDIEKASELFNKYYQNALNEYNVDVENGIETYLHKGERMVYRNTKTGKTETIIADKDGYVVTYCANRCHIDYLETLATQFGIALK